MPGNHPRLFVMAATHVTHILPLRPSPRPSLLSLRLVFFLLLLLLLHHHSPAPFPPFLLFSSSPSYHIGAHPLPPRIIHILHPTPAARVRGKFLNFARIENFHILFLRRSGTEPRALLADCSQSSSSSRSRHATAAIALKNFPKRRSSVRRIPARVMRRSIDDRGKQAHGMRLSGESDGTREEPNHQSANLDYEEVSV